MQLATKYTLLYFSWPLLATFLLFFPVISGPGSKIWLVRVQTQTYGTISIGALGICAGEMCLKSGFGYDPGDRLGTVIPRFPAVGIFHLITLICLILGMITHAYFLPRLHVIRETRLSWAMWIVPAACCLLLLIGVIIDFALLAQLKTDKVLLNDSTVPKDGMQDAPVDSQAMNPSHSVLSDPTTVVSSYRPHATVSSISSAGGSPLPSGVPQKLSLRAIANDSVDANPNTISKPGVSAEGALYLPIISLILCLIWLYAGFHFLRKSKISEQVREQVEQETYRERILARKRLREENPVEENYGWFQFGRQGGGEREEQGKEARAGQGWGLGRFAPAWMGGADKDAAPSGFV